MGKEVQAYNRRIEMAKKSLISLIVKKKKKKKLNTYTQWNTTQP